MNYKTIVAPIVGIVFLALKGLLGIEVSDDLQAQVTDWVVTGVLVGISVYGVFKDHKKKEVQK